MNFVGNEVRDMSCSAGVTNGRLFVASSSRATKGWLTCIDVLTERVVGCHQLSSTSISLFPFVSLFIYYYLL